LGLVILLVFKTSASRLRAGMGGFDSHTPPPRIIKPLKDSSEYEDPQDASRGKQKGPRCGDHYLVVQRTSLHCTEANLFRLLRQEERKFLHHTVSPHTDRSCPVLINLRAFSRSRLHAGSVWTYWPVPSNAGFSRFRQ
jgi:hypothetical protein